ncbi:hypothetical protein HDU86_006510 [Geranomyces michiganensis]|nr:hypothetical protein HDU86_006510 [Geranomyces michiganensis]
MTSESSSEAPAAGGMDNENWWADNEIEEWDVDLKAGLGRRFCLENMFYCDKCTETRPKSCFPSATTSTTTTATTNTALATVPTAICTDCRAVDIPHRHCHACNKLQPTASFSKTQRKRQQPLCLTCSANKCSVWSTGDPTREAQIAAMRAATAAAREAPFATGGGGGGGAGSTRRSSSSSLAVSVRRETRGHPYGRGPALLGGKQWVQPVALRSVGPVVMLDDGLEFDPSEWPDEYDE